MVDETSVVLLTSSIELAKGDQVYAVYPNTTTFYGAIVVQPPVNALATVQFAVSASADDPVKTGCESPCMYAYAHVMPQGHAHMQTFMQALW